MRKKFRFLTVLAVCVMVLSCFSVTAFAYADDTEQNLPVTEATQPEQQPETTPTPEKPKGEPIDDEGNAYTRDLLYDKATNKQFITVQTKNGNTFFIVIDYDAPINEDEEQYQTYFLNMVDESDLLALLDDDTAAALTTCNCKEKCAAGQVNTDCPVCKTNMSECTGTAPVTPEPDKDAETDVPAPKPEKKSNIGMILVIFALAGAAGTATSSSSRAESSRMRIWTSLMMKATRKSRTSTRMKSRRLRRMPKRKVMKIDLSHC